MTTAQKVEIEFDDPQNRNHIFRPLDKLIRGRWDWERCNDSSARSKAWTECNGRGIPGQRLAYDYGTETCELFEPLHDLDHAAIRRRLERMGFEPEDPPVTSVAMKPDTFSFWAKLAVDGGYCFVSRGAIKEFDRDKVDNLTKPQQSEAAVLTTALDKLSDLLVKSLGKA